MKKVFSLLAVLALVCMAGTAFAANFSSTTKQAYANFGSAGDVTFDVKLYDFVANQDYQTGYTGDEATSISFDLSGVQFGPQTEAQWAPGTTFARITTNLTVQPAGHVSMYTTNSTATGDYKANAPRNESGVNKYNGLVRKGNTAAYKDGDFAPIKVLCRKAAVANTSFKSAYPVEDDFTEMYNGGRYLLDSGDGNFSASDEQGIYIGKGGQKGGMWVGYGDEGGGHYNNWYTEGDLGIIFFGAYFNNVIGGDQYGTTTITFIYSAE